MTFNQEDLLLSVRKPGRYIGREWNSVNKNLDAVDVSVVLTYPDAYEVGMSNLGLSILYDIVNADPEAICERVYAPWPDMEQALRASDLSLWSLETKRPLADFDVVGVTLQHELNYANILTILDLGGIPIRAADRRDGQPVVIGGGPCAYNPAPLVSFFDAFVLGDGEEAIAEIVATVREHKKEKREQPEESREGLLKKLADLDGVYVPAFYDTKADPVRSRSINEIDEFGPPKKPLVPYIETIHDRLQTEIMRGCGHACRFCQAGIVYRPVRCRRPENVINAVRDGLASTGYSEVSLVSLSSCDYPSLLEVVKELVPELTPKGITVSLPSQRLDAFTLEISEVLGTGRQTSLTFAPEAGTQRLRDVINKGISEADIVGTAETAFRSGWRKLKLYFMVGLPTETQEDLDGIIDLVINLRSLALDTVPKSEHGQVNITVNVASYIPKAHTPFQWAGQDSLETLTEKSAYLRDGLKKNHLRFKWHEPEMAKLEGALARGDERVADAIANAWQDGARFDSWNEYFDFGIWSAAFKKAGLNMKNYADGLRDIDEPLPWDNISTGVDKDFLRREYEKAIAGLTSEDCLTGCEGCGLGCRESE